jgi:purine-binding chemotaxis protein CheW
VKAVETEARYCTFQLGEIEYALDVADVAEVLGGVERCAVPLAPPGVLGLTNLRGRIVTLLDPATLLRIEGADARAAGALPVSIVLSMEGAQLGLSVDAIGDVVSLPAGSLLPPPATLEPHVCACVRGVSFFEERLITVLETRALLAGFLEESR